MASTRTSNSGIGVYLPCELALQRKYALFFASKMEFTQKTLRYRILEVGYLRLGVGRAGRALLREGTASEGEQGKCSGVPGLGLAGSQSERQAEYLRGPNWEWGISLRM